MTNFTALAKDGKLSMNEYTRNKFTKWLKENDGVRLKITADTPESKSLRGYLEGALIPLIAFYQEGHDHRSVVDCQLIREWLRLEFNAKMTVVSGVARKVGKSTKGREELRAFVDKVVDWMEEQGYEIPNPDEYKVWRDSIKPYSDIDNFIDYQVSIGKLKQI